MALIECDECGHRISDKSIYCPNCGYPTHLNKALREAVTPARTPSNDEAPAQKAVPAAHSAEAAEDTEATVAATAATETTATTDAPVDALAEYEATLARPDTPKANERKKLILYFAVLAVLLILVGSCYYYAKSNHLGSIDEVQCEPIEEILVEETDIVPVADSAAVAAVAADSIAAVHAADSLAATPQPPASPSVTQL